MNVRLSSAQLVAAALLAFANSVVVLRANDAAPPIAYAKLATLEFSALQTTLENAGWPETHVRAFVDAEIQRRLNPPFEPKASDLRPFEFWRTGPDAQPFAPANLRARTAEQERRDAAVREAHDKLFPDIPASDSPALLAWDEKRRWGDLAPEKRQAVAAILARADRERDAMLGSRGGMLTRDEWQQAWKKVEATRTDLAHALTPEELLDYDLRNSTTAEKLRTELDNFQPTKDEFLVLFRLRHPLELSFGHKPVGIDATVDRRRADAEAEVNKKIAALLGPERYDDYQLSLQPACQLLQFDGRFANADARTVRALYRAMLAAKDNLQKIEAPSAAEKNAQSAAIKAALFQKFRAVFDEEGTRRYLQEQSLWP